ncbi:MAG TPA: ADOP family duplicated permease [Vicinamibacterales bacterium]|nr:ADOP family duplicated permease [Vicinamibacterales bacterium]
MNRPPIIAAWLLERLLDRDSREAVAGDLAEEFAELRASRGAAAAAWWYWRATIRSIVSCRLIGERRVERRRMDFDAGGGASLRDLIKPALRQFRDHPMYAFTTVATLALAIGVGAVTFTVVKRAYLDPLSYRDDARLHSVLTATGGPLSAVSAHVFEDLRASDSPFVGLTAVRPMSMAYAAANRTENILANLVEANYFSVLGVTPSLGRVWTSAERDAILISWSFWTNDLESDPNVISRSIVLDARPRTIVGVLPREFVTPYFQDNDVWAPLDMAPLLAGLRAGRQLSVFARRGDRASQADVDAYMAVFSANQQRQHPSIHGNHSWVAPSLRDELVGTSRPAVLGAGAAALLLLLIVTANIAGLSTAHAAATRHHIAIRSALGATRSRLFGEQLFETVVLTSIGSGLGVATAYGLTQLVARYQQQFLGRLAPITLDLQTMFAAIAAGLLIGLVATVLPRRFVGAEPSDALRASRGGSVDARLTRTRTALVTAQVALALVLLVGAGLLIRTVQHLANMDMGFDPDRLVHVQANLPLPKYRTPEAQMQFERDVIERVSRIHGVESAMASVGIPIVGGMMAGLIMKTDAPGVAPRDVAYLSVAPDFMSRIGAKIVAGRDLLPSDDLGAPRVVLINETMARMFWPNGDALGSEIFIGAGRPERWITVVGIVADFRTHGPTERIRPASYGSTFQYSWPRRNITVRVAGAMPATLASELRTAIHAIDPAIPAGTVATFETFIAERTGRHRLASLALTLFGSLALVLCACGLYAVVALTSRLRQREYAIRMALGARANDVRWLVFRQAALIAGVGTAVGIAGAVGGTRILEGLLHGVSALDGPSFAAAVALLLFLAALAAWQPARLAARVAPSETLKSE